MPRFTKAYTSFLIGMKEIEVLRALAARKEKAAALSLVPRHEINALCRGAIVLLCGCLEAYIKELGEIALERLHTKQVTRQKLHKRIYYYISRDLLKEIQACNDPVKVTDKVFKFTNNDLDYWSTSGPLPQPISAERFNRGFSNPGSQRIRGYFSRFGYDRFKQDLKYELKGQHSSVVNAVDHLVHTRNKIAHGDATATKTPSEIKSLMISAQVFCRATDKAFAAWFSTNYCSIR